MRDLLEQIDVGIADAYGWSDLDLSHICQEEARADGANLVKRGIASATRDIVLARLHRAKPHNL